uniref:Uncharacterized protein n=1 Tax=Tanacetum cinerariifolium TaxID=118510 RepID=A0A6L2P567_TANCI|nr:hypothetical protein [Tanacetum cinerariifolium]
MGAYWKEQLRFGSSKEAKEPNLLDLYGILQNTNFFKAFTASASVPAIYLQQFWDTLMFEAKTRAYHFQLDEDWFKLDANLLKEALDITPIDQAHQFVSPPLGDAIMDFLNQLGYPREIHFVSRMATHNIHQRSGSPLNLVEDYLSLGNLKFIPKGEINEHERQITAAKEGGKKKTTPKADKPVKPAPAKQANPATVKQPKPKPVKEKPTNPTPIQKADKGKVIKARTVKSSLQLVDEPKEEQDKPEAGQAHVGSVTSREPEEEATRPLPVVEGKEKAIATEEQATQSLLALHTPKRRSTTDQYIFQRRTPATEEASIGPSVQPQDDTSANVVCETPSPADVDTDKVISEGDTEILNIGEEQGEDVDNQGYLEEQTVVLDEGQTRSDPGKTPESRPPPDDDKMDEDQARSDPGKTHVALARPNPKPMHDDFVATIYPKMHESLKFSADEQVILEDPPRSSRTLSSMKNMDDTYTFGDRFFNGKSTEDETGKQNVDAEVVYMVTVPIHQASTSVPPISTPIIDLSPLKSEAFHLPEPFTAATTETTTTTLPLPPPPQQQSTTNSELAARVTALEKKLSDFEHKSQTLDNVTQNLGSRLFNPLRDRFRELPEADMKEILHQRMFESGSYKSLPEHVALYEALEASMERANRDEFLVVKDKSRHDDQDPPPPLPDSDLNKKKRHDSDASGSKQPPTPQSSAWKMSDTREALSSSSKQQPAPHSEQPVEDVPIPDDMEECYRLLTNQVDLVNSEGHRLVPDVSKWSTRSVRSRMRILSVISIKTFERYKYTFLREIVIHRADYNEYKISKADIKKLHPNDFEDLNIVIKQRVGDLQLGIESYQTKLNLTEPRWDASDFLFKEDYTIISKPRAVIYRDRNDQKKMLKENEVHKFSDGTLTRILHKLDHMVKDFRLYQYNPGMETSVCYLSITVKMEILLEPTSNKLLVVSYKDGDGVIMFRQRQVHYRTLIRDQHIQVLNFKNFKNKLFEFSRSRKLIFHKQFQQRETIHEKRLMQDYRRWYQKYYKSVHKSECPTSMYKSYLGDCHYACQYCNATYISGIEAAWGSNKTENKFEKGQEQVLVIKRWTYGIRVAEVLKYVLELS